jgi:hypothetical protein
MFEPIEPRRRPFRTAQARHIARVARNFQWNETPLDAHQFEQLISALEDCIAQLDEIRRRQYWRPLLRRWKRPGRGS